MLAHILNGHLHEISPRNGLRLASDAIVDRHTVGLCGGSSPRRCYHQVDDNIHRYQIRYAITFAHDGVKQAFSYCRHNARGSVPVVHPTYQRLIETW